MYIASFCHIKFERRKMKVINKEDKNYPKGLLTISDPPEKLFVLGNEEILNKFGLAIVGSRNCTSYGENIAKSLAYNLSKYKINVISGMAKGIDSAAHIGAIIGKGKTIAVLGSGFNHIYPEENIELLKKIIKSGGVVITEYSEDVLPIPKNFPKRNRIISGLSQGVIVVEAGKRSGSLITAEIALDEGKEVFAIPGNVTSKTSKGTNGLIKDGAKLVENVIDILEEYSSLEV